MPTLPGLFYIMGNWWSRTPPSQTYERILSDIDEKIRAEETFLIDLRMNDRRYSVLILLYGLMVYGALLAWIIFMHPREERTWMDVLWVSGYPILVYQLRRLLGAFYARRIGAGEERLKLLRERQKMKVEELKRMTDYYHTKGLIDRFEQQGPESAKKQQRGLHQIATEDAQRGVISRTQPPKPAPVLPALPAPAPAPPVHNNPPGWFDRLVDTIIGDDRGSKYALICPRCHAHNGLVREHELSTVAYICPNCHFPVNIKEVSKSPSLTNVTPTSDPKLDEAKIEGKFVTESSKSPETSSSTTPKQRRSGRKSVNNSPLSRQSQ